MDGQKMKERKDTTLKPIQDVLESSIIKEEFNVNEQPQRQEEDKINKP